MKGGVEKNLKINLAPKEKNQKIKSRSSSLFRWGSIQKRIIHRTHFPCFTRDRHINPHWVSFVEIQSRDLPFLNNKTTTNTPTTNKQTNNDKNMNTTTEQQRIEKRKKNTPNHAYIKWKKRRSKDQTYVYIKEKLLDQSRPYLFRMFQIFDQSGGM